FARNQIVGVVLQHGGSLGVRHVGGHNLHQTHHSGGLPVSLSAEAVALLHQSLYCQARKLLQRAQIAEMSDDSLVILLLQESLKSDLDACLNCYMLSELLGISSLQQDLVFVVLLFHQRSE